MLYAVVDILFGITENWKHTRYSSIGGWLKKLWMKNQQIINMWISSDPQDTLKKNRV